MIAAGGGGSSSVPPAGRDGPPVAALATADGSAAVALVRVSGCGAHAHAAALLDAADPPFPAGRATRATIHRGAFRLDGVLAPDDPAIEPRSATLPVIAVLYPTGRSYTGEESVEWVVPGAAVWVRAVLAALEARGIAPAEPGEFTRRAFESGRIDLTRAESVAALIAAEDLAEARAARRTLEGELAAAVRTDADRIHDLIALLEAGLDFADQEVEPPAPSVITDACREIEEALTEAVRRPDRAATDGVQPRLLLWGRTNAGKSTLLNALTGGDHALTSDEEGTTTDVVGVPWDPGAASSDRSTARGGEIELLDLPGRKDDLTTIEATADRLAARERAAEDPFLYLLAVDRPLSDLLAEWESLPTTERARGTAVLAQVDRLSARQLGEILAQWEDAGHPRPLAVSARTGMGLAEIRALARKMLRTGTLAGRGGALRFNDRQRRRAEECVATLAHVRAELEALGVTEPELVVVDLRRAHASLEEITGEIATEETLTRIFSRFCVGK